MWKSRAAQATWWLLDYLAIWAGSRHNARYLDHGNLASLDLCLVKTTKQVNRPSNNPQISQLSCKTPAHGQPSVNQKLTNRFPHRMMQFYIYAHHLILSSRIKYDLEWAGIVGYPIRCADACCTISVTPCTGVMRCTMCCMIWVTVVEVL